MPKNEQSKGLNDISNIFAKTDIKAQKAGEAMVKMLIERKEKYFSKNKRIIMNYEFGFNNGQPWLNVASSLG